MNNNFSAVIPYDMEQLIKETGIPHTFLRNSWYLEMAAPLAATALKTGRYPYYALAGNNGEADSTPDNFEEVLGHPLTQLAEALKELV